MQDGLAGGKVIVGFFMLHQASPRWISSFVIYLLLFSDGGAFFPGNGNGSAQGSPNSPSGNGNGLPTNNANHVQNVNLTEQSQQQQQLLQQPQVMPTYQVR